jgi:hypothetical protein
MKDIPLRAREKEQIMSNMLPDCSCCDEGQALSHLSVQRSRFAEIKSHAISPSWSRSEAWQSISKRLGSGR